MRPPQRIRLAALLALALVVAGFSASPAAAYGKGRVAALQVALAARGLYGGDIDGIKGPQTTAAVRAFQRRAGLRVDGIAGHRTRARLGRLGRPWLGARVITRGAVGWDVSSLQFHLAWHGFPSGPIDGGFGARTEGAVRRFQRFARLGVDGAAGPATIRALFRPLPRSPLRVSRPVAASIGDRFGPRGNRFHTGVDFRGWWGTRVRAARPGRVTFAGWDRGGYGYLVVIAHGRGVRTWYAHLSRIDVRRGQRVGSGRTIGRVGATGHAFGPHLHFEVRRRGAAVNPLTALR